MVSDNSSWCKNYLNSINELHLSFSAVEWTLSNIYFKRGIEMKRLTFLMCSMLTLSVHAANGTSANIENFTGKFNAACVFEWKNDSVEEFETEASSSYDAILNYLLVELSDRRQLIVFERINEPEVVSRGATDMHLCRRYSHVTELTETLLSTSRSEKTCLLPITISFTKATARLTADHNLNISIKDETGKKTCTLSRK